MRTETTISLPLNLDDFLSESTTFPLVAEVDSFSEFRSDQTPSPLFEGLFGAVSFDHPNALLESSIEAIYLREIEVRRSLRRFEDGTELILLHKDLALDFDAVAVHEKLNQILTDDPLHPGLFLRDTLSPWLDPSNYLKFNCHAFALGARLDISPTDWVEGQASGLTLNQNPMKIALNAFFSSYLDSNFKSIKWDELTTDTSLDEGDIITFYDTKTDSFVHSGVIVKRNGENWCMAKSGDAEIVVTPLKNSALNYTGFDRVQIYKFRANTDK